MKVTEEGMDTDWRDVQSRNASLLMEVTEEGMDIDWRDVHP